MKNFPNRTEHLCFSCILIIDCFRKSALGKNLHFIVIKNYRKLCAQGSISECHGQERETMNDQRILAL